MLFIRLIKLKNPYSKQLKAWFDDKHKEALKWDVKFHHTYFTLGMYDAVSIIEAPDEKSAAKYALATADEVESTTMVAIPKDEVDSWL